MNDERDQESGQDGDARLMQRARAAFDAEAAALDSTTQRRLSVARRAALAGLEAPQRGAFAQWAPLGAAAAVAVIAVGVTLSLRAPHGVSRGVPQGAAPVAVVIAPIANAATAPVAEMELLLGDDELALYDEDPEFYDWAAAEAGADDAG